MSSVPLPRSISPLNLVFIYCLWVMCLQSCFLSIKLRYLSVLNPAVLSAVSCISIGSVFCQSAWGSVLKPEDFIFLFFFLQTKRESSGSLWEWEGSQWTSSESLTTRRDSSNHWKVGLSYNQKGISDNQLRSNVMPFYPNLWQPAETPITTEKGNSLLTRREFQIINS